MFRSGWCRSLCAGLHCFRRRQTRGRPVITGRSCLEHDRRLRGDPYDPHSPSKPVAVFLNDFFPGAISANLDWNSSNEKPGSVFDF